MKQISVLLFLLLTSPTRVLADYNTKIPGCQVLNTSGGGAPSLACAGEIVIRVINILFSFIGAVTLIYLLIGSLKYIVSRGDQKALQSAQKTITYALLGALLVLGTYVLVNIVLQFFGLPSILKDFTLYQG